MQLRPTRPSDLDFVLAAEQHPDSAPYVFQWSREQHLAAFSNLDMAHLIVENSSSEPQLGYVILAGLLDPNQSIQLCRIVIAIKNRGYGKAALEQVKRFAFETHGAHRLWLDVKVGNERAQVVYRAAGFIAEGTLRDCIKTAQGFESLIVMSLLRSDQQSPA